MKFSEWVLASPYATLTVLILIVLLALSLRNPDKVESVINFTLSISPDPVYSDTLHVFSFTEYFDNYKVIHEFEKKHNIKVHITEYKSIEQLYDSLLAGIAYDIIVPTDYMVTQLANEGKIMAIDRDLVSNFFLIDIRFSEMDYDYGNRFSIPYFWGSIGLMYDVDYVPNPPLSWSAIFDTTQINRMRYSISMLDDARMAIGIALITLGYSPNTTDNAQITEAADKLIGLAKYMSSLQSDNLEPLFRDNTLNIAVNWSGNAALIASRNKSIRFALPAEGSIFFVDNLSIPANAKNPKMAHAFIDYLLDPRVAAEITNYTFYPNPITDSRKYVDRIILKGSSYLNPFLSSNITYTRDLGVADTLYTYHYRRFREAYNQVNLDKREIHDGKNRMILF
jgi:spermidine/putrescine transport system substrate-binding protein